MFKFGLYEVFKVYYSALVGEEMSYEYRTSLYLVSSASAEFFADIGLAPLEASKVIISQLYTHDNFFNIQFEKENRSILSFCVLNKLSDITFVLCMHSCDYFYIQNKTELFFCSSILFQPILIFTSSCPISCVL